MKTLLDGFAILEDNWQLVFGILCIMLLCQFLVYSAIKMIFGDGLTPSEYYSLAAAGWILPISLVSLLWFLWGIFQTPRFDPLIAATPIAFFALLLFYRFKKEPLHDSKTILWGLLLLFGTSILLRLAFVSQAILPLYFDSAEHYRIIKNLMGDPVTSNAAMSFKWPTTSYYHLGFHLLAGFISSAMRAEIIKTMLILGQMILAVTPLSIFFILKRETKSNSAGIFAVILSAFGWYMPAYAVNWGKYPALTSLALIQFVLSMTYLCLQSRNTLSSRKQWALYVMLGAGILVSGFTHSRSLVIFGIAILAWATAAWWQNLSKLPKYFVFSIAIIGIILEVIYIQTQDILYPLFDPYGAKGFVVTSIVLFLSIFAQKAYPRLTFSSILAIFLLLCNLFIPVMELIPGYADLTLLDRPFVELILYLPLSLLGGLGLAGLEQVLRSAQVRLGPRNFLWGRNIGIVFIGLVLINALFNYSVYPSDCCDIAGADDLTAIDWMDKNLPLKARVLISSTELLITASNSFQGYAPADAGAWITPLTDRVTFPLLYDTDFGQQNILDTLCELEISYIYIGEIGDTFDASLLRSHPDWYKPLLSMPDTEIYQIVGCH